MEKNLLLSHGSGGRLMQALIKEVFLQHFKSGILAKLEDAAVLKELSEKSALSFTTDSYTVKPIFFPGGDIGKLAVCGTVNDISVSGARPLFLSCGIIAEEGFEIESLERIAISMSMAASEAGVEIVAGDFKVVEKGSADRIFINTSGIGVLSENAAKGRELIKKGDKLVINGFTGDHELAVLLAREEFEVEAEIYSDCAPLNGMISGLTASFEDSDTISFMRDPTRGGIAAVLNEAVEGSEFGIELYEKDIPVNESVKALCEMLGFDPLYLANEGKVLIFCRSGFARDIVSVLKKHEYGRESRIIGEVVNDHPGKVVLNTVAGTRRIVNVLSGSQLPRIC